jgi:hypothetical protein
MEHRARIRRAVMSTFTAELDLDARSVTVWSTQNGEVTGVIGQGQWVPLSPPLSDLRGQVLSDTLNRESCAWLEHRFARGSRTWSMEQGPWTVAERAARAAGVDVYDSGLLRLVMWSFYRGRWPLKFAVGCGFGPEGHALLIADALRQPERMRARWELLLQTGGLRQPSASPVDDSDDVDNPDEFYSEP